MATVTQATPPTVDKTTPDTWVVSGELTMQSLSRGWKALLKNLPERGTWQVNCQAVSKIDSAGLALFLAWLRHAKQHSLALKLTHVNADTHALLVAQGLEPLLTGVISP